VVQGSGVWARRPHPRLKSSKVRGGGHSLGVPAQACGRVRGQRQSPRSPALIRVCMQLVADRLLPSVHGGFDLDVLVISRRVLPRYAPVLGNVLQVAVPLHGGGFGRVAGHRSRMWRHNHGRLRMALGDAGVDAILVVASVAGERRHRAGDLVEQGTGLGRVAHVLGGQHSFRPVLSTSRCMGSLSAPAFVRPTAAAARPASRHAG